MVSILDMKPVFIAGSRKFYNEIHDLVGKLKENNIQVATSGEWDESQEDSFESEKDALLRAFKEMDESEVVYIFCNKGYVGKTVAMEIAYAYAKEKEVISSEEIEEFSARGLVSQVLSSDELVDYCKW